jgi:hypothetical protein
MIEAPGTELDIGHSILEPDQIHMAEKDYNHYPSGYTFSMCHAYHPLSHELEIARPQHYHLHTDDLEIGLAAVYAFLTNAMLTTSVQLVVSRFLQPER